MSLSNVRSKILTEVEATVIAALGNHRVSAEVAADAASQVVESLVQRWGGRVIPFPRETDRYRTRRDAKALKKFDGTNYAALAAEFGMTTRGARKMIARAKARGAGA
ncbi:TPA: hypothetical protein UMV35_002847 [Stenotrophomonas maltophilia]|nr:hypothetical protein [Stenotrophomonas maltophilia]HEL7731243.1 hypothetical protein [Stenotrophomonas maltophilia]